MREDAHPQRLPLVIGVTGHRDLRPQDEAALMAAIETIFERLRAAYPSTPLLLLTPLAEGADQLAARAARRRSVPYRVLLPMPLELYREDFEASGALGDFEELVAHAAGSPYEMPFFEENDAGNVRDPVRRAHQYALVAAHLARAAHMLIAFWDGATSDTVGGTAQAVRFRTLGVPKRYARTTSVIDAPETGAVQQIYTPRRTNATLARAVGSRTLRLRRTDEGRPVPLTLRDAFEQIDELDADAPDPFALIYRRIDTFNEDCSHIASVDTTFDEGGGRDPATRTLMRAAERVATYYQRKFVRALQVLFVVTSLAIVLFQLYADVETDAHPLMLAYLAAAAFALWTYLRARNGRWQDRALDCRALEVGLNVQQAWDAAGLDQSVADFYIRRQRSELDWIRAAIATAHDVDRGIVFEEAHAIETVRAFVLRQHSYFSGTNGGAKREHRKAKFHATFSAWFLRASFVASAFLIAYGLCAWFVPDVLHRLPREELWHSNLIFVIGATAIAAALFHDYPARRAHPQQARRYEAMGDLYRRALDTLDEAERRTAWRDAADGPLPSRLETARACILELGHEALSENGDWLLMHREMPIELLAIG